jgi:hypothetical protein
MRGLRRAERVTIMTRSSAAYLMMRLDAAAHAYWQHLESQHRSPLHNPNPLITALDAAMEMVAQDQGYVGYYAYMRGRGCDIDGY